MKLLITGSTGLIGSSFIKNYAKKFEKIFTLSRDIGCDTQFENIKFDFSKDRNLSIPSVDAIVHFAAQTSAIVTEKSFLDDLSVNSIGTGQLLKASLDLKKRPFFIYIGTATQLGYTRKLYSSDNLPPDSPTTLYDLGKLAGEQLLFNLINIGSIKGCSLRLCNVYGELTSSIKSDRGVLDKIYAKSLKGETIEVLGDGKFFRDYIHVEDVVKAVYCTLKNQDKIDGRVFYIGSGSAIHLREAFETIRDIAFKKSGNFSKINSTRIPKNINQIHLRHFQADIEEFVGISGWEPSCRLRDL